MKKVFVDIYLQFNLGDDLFLDILAKKYPNHEFTLNHLGSNYDEFLSKYHNVKRRKYTVFNKIKQRFKISEYISNYEQIAEDHDAMLFIGGSIFREEEYHKTLYEERLKIVRAFKKRNKPIFILGANFGPVETESFVNDYREFFKLCDDVCFRDSYSYHLFKNLTNVRYAPDIVFQMNIEEYANVKHEKKVGFSIIDVNHKKGLEIYQDEYIKSTISSINLFAEKGYDCCLMSFCDHEGDLKTIETIKAQLPPNILEKVTVYSYDGNINNALKIIASFKLLIAARFHANILGLMLDINVVPIIYSQKTFNMLQDMNLHNNIVTMDKLHLQFDEDFINKSLNNKINLETIEIKCRESI